MKFALNFMKQKDIYYYNICKKKSYIQLEQIKQAIMQAIQRHINLMEQPVLTTGSPICASYFSNGDWKHSGSFETKSVNMS